MKRISLLTLLLLLSGITLRVAAQEPDDDSDPFGNYPERMLTTECAKVTSATSQCNTGTEPFSQFLLKFKTDRAFRHSRINVAEEYGNPEWMAENSNMIKEWTDSFKFPVYQRKTKCNKSYATWYGVEKDIVYYVENEVRPCADECGSTVLIIFRRIDGKWYLTNMMLAG